MQTEKAVLELCKNQGIPVPSIILYEELHDKSGDTFTMVEEIAGEPFITKKLLIFDYDRILAQLAEILMKIHSIRLGKFGYLTPTLVGTRNSWHEFLMQDMDIKLRTLSKKGIFSRVMIKRISKTLDFKPKKAYPVLLHGHISKAVVYVDSNLRISNIINFVQSLSGDPNYEMAGFLVYEGFDRAKRLIRRYHSLGGNVTWDSEELLKTSVRRAIASLYWAIETKQLDHILPRRELVVALIAKSKI
jgi:aminoglycoside phosphotransferase (APT) family kinase protein